jgi:hypothetical protein
MGMFDPTTPLTNEQVDHARGALVAVPVAEAALHQGHVQVSSCALTPCPPARVSETPSR